MLPLVASTPNAHESTTKAGISELVAVDKCIQQAEADLNIEAAVWPRRVVVLEQVVLNRGLIRPVVVEFDAGDVPLDDVIPGPVVRRVFRKSPD